MIRRYHYSIHHLFISRVFEISNDDYKVNGKYVSTRYMTERLYLNRPQLLYERRETVLQQRAENVTKAIEALQEIVDAQELLKESNKGIMELLKTTQKRNNIRPYKLAEIRK